MHTLYIIFVLCVGALLVTVLAAARHIRRHEEGRKALLAGKPDRASEASREPEALVSAGKGRAD